MKRRISRDLIFTQGLLWLVLAKLSDMDGGTPLEQAVHVALAGLCMLAVILSHVSEWLAKRRRKKIMARPPILSGGAL